MTAISCTLIPEIDMSRPVPGLAEVLKIWWAESGRPGERPPTWVPFPRAFVHAAAIRSDADGSLRGLVVARPMVGMDRIFFAYALPGPQRAEHVRQLVEWAHARLVEVGRSKIVYCAFNEWMIDDVDPALLTPFTELGFNGFRAVFMRHPLTDVAEESAVPEGYAVEPIPDERLDEAAEVMLASPEPQAIFWDTGLCKRSIAAARARGRPGFPEGLGQMVTLTRDAPPGLGSMVAFSLTTTVGYVNHVYCLPGHRGRGLGGAMVTRVLSAVVRRGCKEATILTHETNPGAVRLYEKLGFETQVRYPQFYHKR
ncbi:MAG: GNAT family N-acetyltransferase [Planctomycetota bacterium]